MGIQLRIPTTSEKVGTVLRSKLVGTLVQIVGSHGKSALKGEAGFDVVMVWDKEGSLQHGTISGLPFASLYGWEVQ